MIRRRPVMRTAAKTAVVAGTATAVSGRVARRQQRRAMAQEAPAPSPAPVAAPAPAAAPTPTTGGISEESIERLTSLGELRDQGVLTEAEFAEQKAQILGTT